jgi:hypothetical protein
MISLYIYSLLTITPQRHDAVRVMETALLLKHRNASEVLQNLPVKMEAVARGVIPNAGQVLTALIMQTPSRD